MSARFVDPVNVTHPDLPGETHTVSRGAFGVMARNGWVEATSPAARAVVEPPTSSSADVPNPASKEES